MCRPSRRPLETLTTPIADPSSARTGEPDMPPGLGRMHRIDDACAGYELDLAAPGAYIMIAVELHIYPHNAGMVGGEARSLPPLFL